MSGRENAGAAKGRVMLVTTTRGGKRRYASAFPVSALVSVRFPVSPIYVQFNGRRVFFSLHIMFCEILAKLFLYILFSLAHYALLNFMPVRCPDKGWGWCQKGHLAVQNVVI